MESDLELQSQSLHISERDGSLHLKQLTLADARTYFNSIEASREHLDTPYAAISPYYPTVESVMTSIVRTPLHHQRFGIWNEGEFRGSIEMALMANREAEIGYWIGADHVGNNFASRSARLITEWAFLSMNVESVYAKIHKENIASKRVATKADFFFTDSVGEMDIFTRERSMGAAGLADIAHSRLAS